jgi:signal transduction histidine kinase
MPSSSSQIIIGIVLGSLVFLLLGFFFILIVIRYSHKKRRLILENLEIKRKHEEELTSAALEAQEQALNTVSSELHDNIGPILVLSNATLSSLNVAEAEKASEKIEVAKHLLQKAITEIRQVSHLLNGRPVLTDGITNAIDKYAEWLRRSGTYTVNYTAEKVPASINHPQKDLLLYRVVQESINNILKHAAATEIDIRVAYQPKNLIITIVDNGRGFNVNSDSQTTAMGLAGMIKKMQLINGTFNIDSNPNKGTTVTLHIKY